MFSFAPSGCGKWRREKLVTVTIFAGRFGHFRDIPGRVLFWESRDFLPEFLGFEGLAGFATSPLSAGSHPVGDAESPAHAGDLLCLGLRPLSLLSS